LVLKILIYSHSFAPAIGGAETYAMLLSQGLANHDVELGGDDIDVRVVTQIPARDCEGSALPIRVLRRPTVAALARLVHSADVVHVVGPCFLPMLFGLILRKPVVVEHHGYQAICPNGLLLQKQTGAACPGHFMARRYGQCLGCNASDVGWLKSLSMTLSTFPRRWMCTLVTRNLPITRHVSRRLTLPRSQVIYYGIEDRVASDLVSPVVLTKPFCFAYVGRLVAEKGLSVLLQAAKQLKNWGYEFRLQFIGDGPERVPLQELTSRLGLRDEVAFMGFRRGEALENALKTVAVVVMPTLMEETAGLAVIEQMMRGRLVIVSDIGGLSEVVADAGLKFVPGNVGSLTSCLQRVLDEPAIVHRLGEKARQRAAQFFVAERMIAEHLALYRALLMHTSPPLAYETLS
jgi:glycosyltransferase involved in cell wall biosynthesis